MYNNKLRNIGIVAHVDAGKTTITEHILYLSGESRTIGSVDKGTAYTDWLDVERERGISVKSAFTTFKWKGTTINLIDTPGHADFSGEVERVLRVLDGAVLVVSAADGVQAQTEILWRALRNMEIPTIIFVNKVDRIGSNISKTLDEIKKVLSHDIVPVELVVGEGGREPGIINIWQQAGEKDQNKLHEMLTAALEYLADKDENILVKYINDEPVPAEDLINVLVALTHKSKAFPVFFGSAIDGIGIKELLDGMVQYLPGPSGSPNGPLSGVIFKIDRDPVMGRIAHVRLYNGKLENRDEVLNVTRNQTEKVTQIRKTYVQKYKDIGVLNAGDIGSICGFQVGKIGDVLGSHNGVPKHYAFATPLLKVQVYPQKQEDYPKLVEALHEMADEDPLLDTQWVRDKQEIHINIMGTIQLEILASLLMERFGLNVKFGKPSVIYKETPSKAGEGYVRYTMPKPCWAVLRFLIEPGERGSGLVYSSQVRDEDILIRYQNQVRDTLPKALEQGLYGWEVIDLKVTLIGGEYHVMHTHPLDFVVATPMGIMDGLANTGTTLLEPTIEARISVPEEVGGRVISDVVQMRGSFDSPVISDGVFTVECILPVATSMDYPVKLSSISGGRGTISTKFHGYQECPLELGATCPRRGVNPLDRAKYILSVRNAL